MENRRASWISALIKCLKLLRKTLTCQCNCIIDKQIYAPTWCPICENQVSQNYKDIKELLDHIRTCHSPVADDRIASVKQKPRFRGLRKTAKRWNLFKKSSGSTRKIQDNVSESQRGTRGEKILCPACNAESAPLLFEKRARKFISNCHLGAMCLLGCWPLCFVPLMISRDKRVRMVCPVCGYDYGTYDVRNAKDSAIIVHSAETLLGTTEISSKKSRMCCCSEKAIPVNTCDQSTNVEKPIEKKFDDVLIAQVKNEKVGLNHRENRFDGAVQCTKNEASVKEAKTFPTELFDYAMERVNRKIQPMDMEPCEFCLAEVNSDTGSLSQRLQKISARHRPLSKCYDDRRYSATRRRFPVDENSVSMVRQHARCSHENLNDRYETKENTKGTHGEIICRHRDERSCVRCDDRTNEHSVQIANDENCYKEGNHRQDWG